MPEMPTTHRDEDSAAPPLPGAALPDALDPRCRAVRGASPGRSLILLLAVGLIAVAAAFGWQSKLTEGRAPDLAAESGWGAWGFGGLSPEFVEQPDEYPSAPFAFSPDGTVLASGSGGGAITLWDVRSGHISAVLYGHEGLAVASIAFSPDGASLATVGYDSAVIVWDLVTHKRRLSIPVCPRGFEAGTLEVAWHPSGRWLAASVGAWNPSPTDPGRRGRAGVWDARTGARVKSLPVHATESTALAFSPDGRWLVTGSSRGLGVWDWQRARSVSDGGIRQGVGIVAFSPDGRWLSVSHQPDLRDGRVGHPSISLLETSAFSRVKAFPSGSTCFAFTREKPALVFTDTAGHLWKRRLDSGEEIRIVPSLRSVGALAVDGAGTRLVADGPELRPRVSVYDLASGEIVPGFRAPQDAVWDLCFLGPHRIAVRTSSTAVVHDLAPETHFLRVLHGDYEYPSMYSSPSSDGRFLALDGGAGLRVVDLESGKRVGSLPVGRMRAIYDFAWIPGRHALFVTEQQNHASSLSGAPPSTVQWDPLASKTTALPFPTGDLVAIHPEGVIAVICRNPKTWEVIDGTSGRPLATLPEQAKVQFSPDGQWMAGSQGGVVRIWEGRTARPVATLRQHKAAIIGMSFSDDGHFLATSDRHVTCVWDLRPLASPPRQDRPSVGEDSSRDPSPTITLLTEGPGDDHTYVNQRFSPDGKTLLLQHTTHAFQAWDVPTGARLGTLSFQYAGTRWFFLTADGRYDGSDDILPRIDVRLQGQVYPLTNFDRGHYSPGLLASILDGQRPPMPPRLRGLPCPSAPLAAHSGTSTPSTAGPRPWTRAHSSLDAPDMSRR